MAKFAIVFCMLLAASVAHAEFSSMGERGDSEADMKNPCSHGIFNLFTKVASLYEKVMVSALNEEVVHVATVWYNVAARDLYALYKEATDPATKMPVEDNALGCSHDIAYKAYKAFYLSWNGLDELRVGIAEQRVLIEKARIEWERKKKNRTSH